jgi:hemerythrin-like metal-binding protein
MEASSWTIEWSDALSMSNPEIDAQHQNFIKLVNELNNVIGQQCGKADMQYIMRLLLEDAIAHFSHEEALFAEKAYPAAQEHTQIHSEIINKFEQAVKTFTDSIIRAVWIKEGLEIRDLLISHLLNDDTKYIECLRTE